MSLKELPSNERGNSASITATNPIKSIDRTKSSFNPEDRKFRTACCHCRSFTVVFSSIELILLCFLLITIAPEFNTATLKPTGNFLSDFNTTADILMLLNESLSLEAEVRSSNYSDERNKEGNETTANWSLNLIRQIDLLLNRVWLFGTLVQLTSVVLMFYGIRNQRWILLIPHIVFRAIFICGIGSLAVLLLIAFFGPLPERLTTSFLCVLLILDTLFFLFALYVVKNQIRCAQFLKLSRDTGFSISNIRPVGPSTLSLSNYGTRPNQQPVEQSPQLKQHTYITPTVKNNTNSSVIRLPIITTTTTTLTTTASEDRFEPIEQRKRSVEELQDDGPYIGSPLPPLRHTYKPQS